MNTTVCGEPVSVAPRHWATRLLPSLTDVAFIAPIAFVFLVLDGAQALLGDGDTGWHVRAGEWMLANGTVPQKDLFSFTRPNEPWFAWEWLWELGAGWLHQRWGLAAVVLVSLFVISLTSALLYRLALKKCGDPLIAIGLTLMAQMVSAVHWLARPHLFTLLFAVIFYWILESVREGRTRLLWLMPPLTVLWTNLHGGFLVGIVLLGSYAAGELLAVVLRQGGSVREAWIRMRPYVLTGAACAAASSINPYFYRLHVHIYRYFAESYHFENISEFLSISFHHPVAGYFEGLLLVGVLAVAWHLQRRDFTSALLIVGWAHLALISARNIPLFAIVVVPPAGMMLRDILKRGLTANLAGWIKRSVHRVCGFAAEIGSIESLPRIHAASVVTQLFLALALLLPFPFQKCRAEFDAKAKPVKAIAYLRSLGAAARIYTDDEWGDYLVYNRFRVFIDGRSDFYGSEFGKNYLDVLKAKYTWREVLSRHGVDTVLLPVDSAFASALKEARDWRVTYDDRASIVFRRAPAQSDFPAADGSGLIRDRAITKTETRDPKIAQSYARR